LEGEIATKEDDPGILPFFSTIIMASSMRITPSLVRPLGLVRPLQQQPFLAPRLAFSQLPKTTILGVRSYASNQQQGKQILLRDHGVFGKI